MSGGLQLGRLVGTARTGSQQRLPVRVMKAVLTPVLTLVFRPQVTSRSHLPRLGPAVLACNHISYLDWMLLPLGVRPRRISFLANRSTSTSRAPEVASSVACSAPPVRSRSTVREPTNQPRLCAWRPACSSRAVSSGSSRGARACVTVARSAGAPGSPGSPLIPACLWSRARPWGCSTRRPPVCGCPGHAKSRCGSVSCCAFRTCMVGRRHRLRYGPSPTSS